VGERRGEGGEKKEAGESAGHGGKSCLVEGGWRCDELLKSARRDAQVAETRY
jgi:hypothetical protein